MNIINRMTSYDDASALLDYFSRNKAHFKAWEPIRPDTFEQLSYWQEQVALRECQQHERKAAYWVAVDEDTHTILAHCSVTNIVHGAFMAGFMGYAVDKEYEGKGIAKQLSLACIHYAFNELSLNRVMANYMPSNTRSEGLLAALGFAKEGYAKKYLKINGEWEDHVMTSLVNPRVE